MITSIFIRRINSEFILNSFLCFFSLERNKFCYFCWKSPHSKGRFLKPDRSIAVQWIFILCSVFEIYYRYILADHHFLKKLVVGARTFGHIFGLTVIFIIRIAEYRVRLIHKRHYRLNAPLSAFYMQVASSDIKKFYSLLSNCFKNIKIVKSV